MNRTIMWADAIARNTAQVNISGFDFLIPMVLENHQKRNKSEYSDKQALHNFHRMLVLTPKVKSNSGRKDRKIAPNESANKICNRYL